MKNVLWNIFEIAINFYQGAAAVWFIYNFLIPKSVKQQRLAVQYLLLQKVFLLPF